TPSDVLGSASAATLPGITGGACPASVTSASTCCAPAPGTSLLVAATGELQAEAATPSIVNQNNDPMKRCGDDAQTGSPIVVAARLSAVCATTMMTAIKPRMRARSDALRRQASTATPPAAR